MVDEVGVGSIVAICADNIWNHFLGSIVLDGVAVVVSSDSGFAAVVVALFENRPENQSKQERIERCLVVRKRSNWNWKNQIQLTMFRGLFSCGFFRGLLGVFA